MSAQVIPFPVERSRSVLVQGGDSGTRLVEAIRQKILVAGGTWDPDESAPHVQRIVALLAEAAPIPGWRQ